MPTRNQSSRGPSYIFVIDDVEAHGSQRVGSQFKTYIGDGDHRWSTSEKDRYQSSDFAKPSYMPSATNLPVRAEKTIPPGQMA